jgi:hypothetical protein
VTADDKAIKSGSANVSEGADKQHLPPRMESKSEVGGTLESELQKLKKEILAELSPKKPWWQGLLGHPAFLLVVGFLFTTVLGAMFSSCWQNTQSELDRKRITREEVIKQKYEIKDDVIKSIAETNTAAEDLLASYGWDPRDSRRKVDAIARLQKWQQASANWRTRSKILAESLRFRFNSPDVLRIFREITTRRSDVGSRIQSLQRRVEVSAGKVSTDKNFTYSIFGGGDFDVSGLVKKLRSATDPLTQYLRSRLSKEARNRIDMKDDSKLSLQILSQLLTEDLNQWVTGPSLYQPDRFAAVALCPETKLLLLKKKPSAATLLRLNRLLLEDAYPAEISRSQNFEDEVLYANCLLSEMDTFSLPELMEVMRAEIREDEGGLPVPAPTPSAHASCAQASSRPCQPN